MLELGEKPCVAVAETPIRKEDRYIFGGVIHAAAFEKYGAADETGKVREMIARKNPGPERAKTISQ